MENKKTHAILLYQEELTIATEVLTDEQLGKVIRAIFNKVFNGKDTKLTGAENYSFVSFMKAVNRSIDEYNRIRTNRSLSGSKHTGNQYTRKKMEQNGTNGTGVPILQENGTNGTIPISIPISTPKSISTPIERERKADKSATRTHQTPTLEEVESHCVYLGLSDYTDGTTKSPARLTAEKFYDHFNSVGWVDINNRKIVDWRSRLANWIRDDFQRQQQEKKKRGSTFTDEQTDALITMFTGSANS